MPRAGIPSQPSWVKVSALKHQKIMKLLFQFIYDMMVEHRCEWIGILQCCTPKFSPAASLKASPGEFGEFQSVISEIHRHHHSLSPKKKKKSHRTPKLKQTPAQPPQTLLVHGAGPAPPPHRTWGYFGNLKTTEPPKRLNIHKPHICLPLEGNLNIKCTCT